ncbi:MAG: metallophosphoesterase family protein [Bacteroidota bacterium]
MKIYVLALLALSSLFFIGCSEEADREDLHFYVAGHVCGGPTDTTGGLYKPFQAYFDKTCKDKTMDFGVFAGDIVYKCDAPSWTLIDQAIKKSPYKVYFAPGNQDLRDGALYAKRYGNGNQHFEKGNCLFIIWDVIQNGWNVSDAQLNEFLKLTSEKEYDNVFIFVHQAIWQNPGFTPQIIPNDTEGRAPVSEFYPNTITALSQTETPVYLFAGDVGAMPVGSELTIHKYKNLRFIASGMGGGKWDNVIDVTVKNGKASVNIHYLNGQKPMNIDDHYVPIVF